MIRIMLVEDEPPTLRALKILIEKISSEFCIVSTASDGKSAVEILETTPVDVVFTDIMMPIEDGFHVLDYISNNQPNTLCVILSGYGEFDYAKKALAYKVVDYLLKPISKGELTKILNKLKLILDSRNNTILTQSVDIKDLATTSTDQIMSVMETYLKTHLEDSITHQTLSELYGFSAAYLSKLFKNYRGLTPTEYLTNLRIEKAKILIEENPSLLTKNIASLTGFTDPFYFSKIFKKSEGISPKEYKKIIRQR